jgi:hypothetical protein
VFLFNLSHLRLDEVCYLCKYCNKYTLHIAAIGLSDNLL